MTALSSALSSGKDVKLSDNITLNSPLTFDAGSVGSIDLNGKSITATGKGLIVKENSNISIKNGKIISTDMGIRIEGSNSTLNIGSDVVVESGSCCVFVPKDNEDVTVNISGNLTSTSTQYPAVCTNGYLANSTMNISGGSIVSDAVAVYFPSNGNLTISGGDIKGKESAVEYRGTGLLKITGGTFKTTTNTFVKGANSNGTTISGAAVVVSPHNGRTPNVEITGGTFIADNPTACYAFWEGPVNSGTQVGTVSINGWNTTGLVHSSRNTSICTQGCTHEH